MAFYDNTKFNEVDINSLEYIEVDRVNTEALPEVVLSAQKLARQDGSKLYLKEYGARRIVIEGRVMAPDRAGFITARDNLLKYLRGQQKRLEVPVGNSPREATATLENCVFSDVGGGYGRFTATFLCADPFLYDVYRRTIINGSTTTSAAATFELLETAGGSYETPPYIRLVLASAGGGTGKYIELSNQAGEAIRVTRDWITADTLILDMLNKDCLVNGAITDYTGLFWNISPGDTSLIYSDNMTSRSVSLIVTYKRRYL